MRYYPLYVDLKQRRCLVVGGGGVGCRKARSLADAGASVLVIDTADASVDMTELCSSFDNIRFECRPFTEYDLDNLFLVFACTSDHDLNNKIAVMSESYGVLCNIADQPEKGHFIVPASVCRGDLCVAISTAGKSPAMARRVRAEIGELIGEEYGTLLTLMGRLRPYILDLGLETRQNTDVFRTLVFSGLADALKKCDLKASQTILEETLPTPLHNIIPELLDGLV